jgi:hypothetical protein
MRVTAKKWEKLTGSKSDKKPKAKAKAKAKKPAPKAKAKTKAKHLTKVTLKPKKKVIGPKVTKGTRWEEHRKCVLLRTVEVIGLQNRPQGRRAVCKVTYPLGKPSPKTRDEVKIACRRLQERFHLV